VKFLRQSLLLATVNDGAQRRVDGEEAGWQI
jgi:hypothetical protein